MKALKWLDLHPAFSTLVVALALFVGFRIWSCLSSEPILLAQVEPRLRTAIYGQIAGSAVAILGISLTVLAILIALPDRPVINDIRASDTWPLLRGLLLTIGLLALLTMMAAHFATAVDHEPVGNESLEQLMLAAGLAAVLALLVAGGTFALLLVRADDPDDPSRDRAMN